MIWPNPTTLEHLGIATLETVYVVCLSGLFSGILGLGSGLLLFALNTQKLCPKPKLYQTLSLLINTMRSIPFIIFMIAIIPLTRLLIGTAIGTTASIVPLRLAAMPLIARMTETSLYALPQSLLEAAEALGASHWQMIWYFILPEAKNSLVRSYTVALVTLVGYASMAGAIGGGGLGDFAIRYGYQRFDASLMLITIIIIWLLVQIIEWLGHTISKDET